MVNNARNVSAYTGTPPENPDHRRIDGGPLYDPAKVLSLLALGDDSVQLWTRKCFSDVQRFEMDLTEVGSLVEIAVTTGRYIRSEWCSNKPGGPWAACDSYKLSYKQWVEAAHKDMMFEYYVKFAIAATGALLLIVSCHPPEERV